MTTPMITAPATARTRDRRVLARMNATAPSRMVPADVLHGLGALVARQDVARQVEREEDGGDARDGDDPLERIGVQGSAIPPTQDVPGRRVRGAPPGARDDSVIDSGMTSGGLAVPDRTGTFQAGAECIKGSFAA